MPDSALDGLSLFLRRETPEGGQSFTLYAESKMKFDADRRRRLHESGIDRIYVRAADRTQFRRQLESEIESVVHNPEIDLPVRCEIIYESNIELISEVYATRNFSRSMPRMERIANSILSLHTEDSKAFKHFFSAAHHNASPATHAGNVATWLPALAIAAGESRRSQLNNLCLAALLSDAGMSCMPAGILNKEAKLNPVERQQIRQHPELGAQLLREIPNVDPAIITLALQHHERLDGTGYPRGLTFDQISHPVRMFAVIDSFAALTSARAYRGEIMSPAKAMAIIRRDCPHKYDPAVVDTWTNMLREVCPEMFSEEAVPDCLTDGTHGRRRFERFNFRGQAVLRQLHQRGGMWMEGPGPDVIMQNLSRGGVGLHCRVPLKVDQCYRLIFRTKQGGEKKMDIKLVRLRNCSDGWYDVGATFIDLTQQSINLSAPPAPAVAPVPAPSPLPAPTFLAAPSSPAPDLAPAAAASTPVAPAAVAAAAATPPAPQPTPTHLDGPTPALNPLTAAEDDIPGDFLIPRFGSQCELIGVEE